MKSFLLRWLVTTIAVLVAVRIVPGLHCESLATLVVAALILGILNAFLKPILVLLSLPLVLVTFGLFLPVINALLLMVTSWLVPEFHVDGFWWAVLGAIVISIVSFLINALVRAEGRTQIAYRGARIEEGGRVEKVIDI